ncbi:hypothetical protein SUBVAR_06628 [Subdoligranulum variabile DSM 15176]|uniref:Uncharacterized protein n=1 Tax=Subdoligranulum variabile DSM 15176 TaxID=411471 RepID=D1PQF9_9FIRM|nr:hypothetical protein SUBVAR_06628 [Subdoligranulum variabile DSM 15176]
MGRLPAPAGEYLVGVVVVVMMPAAADAVLVVVVLVMVMIVMMAALALLMVMIVMVAALMLLILVMMVVAALMLLILVMMVVAAFVLLVLVMMMVVAALVLLVLVMMMVAALVLLVLVMMMVAALMLLAVLMVVMVVMLLLAGMGLVGGPGLVQQLGHQVALAVHDRDDLGAGQGGPVGGDDGGGGVLLGEQGHGVGDLLFAGVAGAAEDDAGSMADLVIVELAEVLHIHLDLVHIGHGDKAVEDDGQGLGHAFHGAGHVGQLAHAGGLDEDAVGVVGLDDLFQGLPEVAHQGAADAAGVQFVDLDAGLPHEAAVNADLAEFVFDQDDALPGEALLDQFLDERGLACAQKAGKNINFGLILCHDGTSVSLNWLVLAVVNTNC